MGNGTSGSPLGVSVPLILSGSVNSPGGVIEAINTADFSTGIMGTGGPDGAGVVGKGIDANGPAPGTGVRAVGGSNTNGAGGTGMRVFGGSGTNGTGGFGLLAMGGDSSNGFGGGAMFVTGGAGRGVGNFGGIGISAFGGAGLDGASTGLAGNFNGDVTVSGNLSKGGGSFKIDHPLDPENKYLYHSFVESPDMKNIYDGVVTLDANGEAIVKLPQYFEALNKDFRYLLTAIGAPGPGLYVAEKISDNQFKIAGGVPGMEVSWQVTGIRQDAYAKKNRIKVEVEKTEKERGYYVHPDAFGKSEEQGIEWGRSPELMRQMKEAHTAAQQKDNNR
jgi:hypothetical protein